MTEDRLAITGPIGTPGVWMTYVRPPQLVELLRITPHADEVTALRHAARDDGPEKVHVVFVPYGSELGVVIHQRSEREQRAAQAAERFNEGMAGIASMFKAKQ